MKKIILIIVIIGAVLSDSGLREKFLPFLNVYLKQFQEKINTILEKKD